MRRSQVFWMAFVSLVMMAGCAASGDSTDEADTLQLTGRVHYVDVEGGCWQFVSEGGDPYELTGDLAVRVQQNGLKLRIRARLVTESASVCMVGTLIEILEILHIGE